MLKRKMWFAVEHDDVKRQRRQAKKSVSCQAGREGTAIIMCEFFCHSTFSSSVLPEVVLGCRMKRLVADLKFDLILIQGYHKKVSYYTYSPF